MNQNQMDRYYWRTGQRWSADDRPEERWRGVTKRAIVFLAIAYVVTVVMMYVIR